MPRINRTRYKRSDLEDEVVRRLSASAKSALRGRNRGTATRDNQKTNVDGLFSRAQPLLDVIQAKVDEGDLDEAERIMDVSMDIIDRRIRDDGATTPSSMAEAFADAMITGLEDS